MKLPDTNLQVYKTKNLSHIFVHAFCLHFIRTHQDYFFQKSFRSRSFRSSHSEVFLGKDILKICSRFKGECPCRSVILIKLLCNFIEITLQHGCSPINLLHIFRTPFLKNTSEWLLLSFFFMLMLSCVWVLSNKLGFFVSCNTKITWTSFFLLDLCVLICTFL